jgi:hypothetical protein
VGRLPGFTSSHFVNNDASAGVLRKLGFEPTGRCRIVCTARGHEVEAVTYWLAASPAAQAQTVVARPEPTAPGRWRAWLSRLGGRPA